jgi:DNA-binding MarR family transcriptional regulator
MIDLSAAGLNKTETKCYAALLEKDAWAPREFAEAVNETRTNCYKILDKFVELGLAERFKQKKKLHYRASNPSRLLELARAQRGEREQAEKRLELHAQELSGQYIKLHEQPGLRFFQGKKELEEIYNDQVKSNQPIYIIRPDYNMDLYDFDFMTEIRHMARKAGIQRYAITPDREKAPVNYETSDPFMLLSRTWMKAGHYTAPVEWNAYGDKLAIMSYGEEAIGMIIESAQIAEAFRQLYKLIDTGLRRDPDYKNLPIKAKFIGATK